MIGIATKPRPTPARRGLMLVEAVVCVVIVAVMLVAALETVAASARARRVQVAQSQGPSLARHLLAEIRQCRYAEHPSAAPPAPLGPEADEIDGRSRALFDDVDDYHGWDESPSRARDGTNLKGGGEWRRRVTVEYVRPDAPGIVVTDDQGLKRITVSLTGPGGSAVTLVALRSRYGAYDQVPRTRTTYLSGLNVQLRLGPEGKRVHAGANPTNQVEVTP